MRLANIFVSILKLVDCFANLTFTQPVNTCFVRRERSKVNSRVGASLVRLRN